MKLRTTLTLGLLAFALTNAPHLQAQTTWNKASGNWADGSNWTPTNVPSGVAVIINNGGTVNLSGTTPNITTLTASGGSKLVISSTASLTTSSSFWLGNTGTGTNTLTMTSGTLAIGAETRIGSATANSAVVNFSGGTWTGPIASNFNILSGGTFNISGSASLSANINGVVGVLNQSGGTVNPLINLNISGTYNLSGGTLATPSNRSLSLGTTGVLKVIGSASTFNLGTDIVGTGGTLAFVLDNSNKHITTIQVAKTTAMNRSGTLAASLAGGILLSGKDHFDLIEAAILAGGTDFTTKPTAAAGNLWNTTVANDVNGTRDAVRITLNSALLQGTLDDADAPTLTLGSNISKGYINLDDFGDAIVLNISLGGGVNEANSLLSFQTALTNANVTWSTSTVDGFDIALTLDGATAGKEYFAWDFSTIEGMGTGYGINAISSIPEPGTVAGLILGGSVLMLALRKRHKSES